MKPIFIFIFSFWSLSSFAQLPIDNKLIPETVKKHFAEKFPTVGAVVWTQPSPGFLETTFSLDKHLVTALFSVAFGECISTDTKLKAEEFPAVSNSYLAANLTAESKVTAYYKSETRKGISYYCEVKNHSKKYTYSFNADGNFVSQVEDDE